MTDPALLPTDGSDGSMETILASIRRIIREDEAAVPPTEPDATATAAAPPTAVEEEEDELLVLDPSMMLRQAPMPEPAMETAMPTEPSPETTMHAPSAADLAAALFDDEPAPLPVQAAPPPPAPPQAQTPALAPPPIPAAALPRPTLSLTEAQEETLLAPQTRAAATQSLAALQEALKPEPPAALRVYRSGGPTLEDLVRDELRGELARWLDQNLPEMVERLVRQEIEQLVRRPA